MSSNNLANAQSQNWLASIAGYPDVSFKIHNWMLPNVMIGLTTLGGTQDRQLVLPGDHIDLDPLSFEFLVDADYRNYEQIFNWIRSHPRLPLPELRDVSVTMLNAQHEPQGLVFVYTNAWPQSISTVPLDPENADTDLQCSVTFNYDDFYIERRST